MFFATRSSFASRRHAVFSGWAAFLLACVCSGGGTAFAVTLPPTVVVTATRIETPLSEVIAPTLVIDRDTIERSGRQ
jgi:outer membrane cobalamin receptor